MAETMTKTQAAARTIAAGGSLTEAQRAAQDAAGGVIIGKIGPRPAMPAVGEGDHPAARIVTGYLAVAVEAMLIVQERLAALNTDDPEGDPEGMRDAAWAMEIGANHIQKYLSVVSNSVVGG